MLPARSSLRRFLYTHFVTPPLTTEQRNPRTRGLDLLSTLDLLRTMNREDHAVLPAVRRALPSIARAVDATAAALRKGGRLIYVGAGTSGRLAVLDAAELPPTFGIAPRMAQAVIAGGRRALTHAVEGAEDDAAAGARDLRARKISSRDVIVGLTASGATPYVRGALAYARRRGALTIGIACNARPLIARASRMLIVLDTGPEVLAGSTRLKAGTAQKLALNLLSTATMVRLGRVYDNWMIGVALRNSKLRRRAARILEEAAGVSVSRAQQALRLAGHDLPTALLMLKRGVNAGDARRRLEAADGNLRIALGEGRPTRRSTDTGRRARVRHG
jgi:N-acetylmuramic acid 6-phosphate etherase